MGMVNGRTQWDFQREQVQQQFSDEQQRQIEQLDAYLASQGISGGAAAQARNDLIQQLSLQRAGAMNEIGQQEAAFLSEAAIGLQQQRFSREERLGDQAFTADITYAQLNQRERELAEHGRQFDNRIDFDAWATEQGYTDNERQRVWQALQNDEDRRLTAAELQVKVDDMRNQLALDYERLRTSVGLEREQILYNIWETEQQVASTERTLQYRTWADQQLAVLNSDLEMGRWEDQTQITQRQTSYYNMGKAGVEIPADQLEALRTQDPLAYYAYLDGRAGLSSAVFDANMSLRDTWFRASITSIGDLEGQQFIDAMNSIFVSMDTLFGEGGQFYQQSPLTEGFPVGMFAYNPYASASVASGATVTTASTAPGATVTTASIVPGATVTTAVGANIYTGSYAPGDANAGYIAPTGTILNGIQPYVTNGPGYPTPANGVTATVGQSGQTTLWRGNLPNTNVWQFNNYTPQYSFTTPQAVAFVANPPAVDTAYASHYLYDDASLRAAASTNMSGAAGWGAVQLSGGTGHYGTYESSIAMLLNNAGRATQHSGQTVVTPNARHVVDPSTFVPVDPEYFDQLLAEGNTEALVDIANGNNRFVNIGGQPFVVYQPRDAAGNLLNGMTLMSVTDPTYTIDWVSGGTPVNPVTSSGR